MIIDTHAHIDVSDYEEDREAVIAVSYTHLTLPTKA